MIGDAKQAMQQRDEVKDRIAIADDHGLVRSSLQQLIEGASALRVVCQAASGEELLSQLRTTTVDLVLLDLSMPGLAGMALIHRLQAEHPALPVLVLSMHHEAQIVTRVLKSGAAGYVTKDCAPDTLLAALHKVLAGGRFIDPALVDAVVFHGGDDGAARTPALSPREQQILELICAGLALGEIADRLHLSPKTVSTHKMRLMHKLEVDSNAELLKYALRSGLVQA